MKSHVMALTCVSLSVRKSALVHPPGPPGVNVPVLAVWERENKHRWKVKDQRENAEWCTLCVTPSIYGLAQPRPLPRDLSGDLIPTWSEEYVHMFPPLKARHGVLHLTRSWSSSAAVISDSSSWGASGQRAELSSCRMDGCQWERGTAKTRKPHDRAGLKSTDHRGQQLRLTLQYLRQ